ncbi:MAG: hypothetical protein O8C63_11330 [Candidatus Methanoperedens sp.]|nr:hypothetical protein [Candidatus Methanoperedens sp.]
MADEEKKKRDMPEAQELKEILAVVSTEIPKLLESISTSMYKPENAENFGKSIATFYAQLKAAGMDDKQAYELTQKYMTNFNLGGMFGQFMHGHGNGPEPDFDGEVGKKIKEKIKKAMDEDD